MALVFLNQLNEKFYCTLTIINKILLWHHLRDEDYQKSDLV